MTKKDKPTDTLFLGVKPKKLPKDELSEKLIAARNGDSRAYEDILAHMFNYLRHLTKEFFIQGSDSQDVFQEGAIKLLNVIQKYDETKGSFNSFAQSSIRKHIITKLNQEQAKKRSVLNSSLSLDDQTKNQDGETVSYIDTLACQKTFSLSKAETPNDIIQKDYEEYLIDVISEVLSPMEQRVFILRYIDESSYREIAEKLGLFKEDEITGEIVYDQKSVDNAIWRSRPKIRRVLEKLNLNPYVFDRKSKKGRKKIQKKSLTIKKPYNVEKSVSKVVTAEQPKKRGRKPK